MWAFQTRSFIRPGRRTANRHSSITIREEEEHFWGWERALDDAG
jgi:hypothetical protein